MKLRVEQFSFVELPVRDFTRARHFYEEVLAFQLTHLDEPNQWCLYKIASSQTGCALYHAPEHRFSPLETPIRLVMQVDDLDNTLAQLTKRGIRTEAVRHHQGEDFHISGFKDFDGHTWRIWASDQPLMSSITEDIAPTN